MSEHDIPECTSFSHGPSACSCICHEPQRGARNYCEYGHYEEFDYDDRSWPKCKNEAFLEDLEARKGLDCE